MADAITTIVSIWNSVKLIVLLSAPLILFLILFVYAKVQKRYPVKVTIWERRADNSLVEIPDRMKRIIDKDGLYKYRFKKTPGDAIIVINYDWLVQTAEKPMNIFEKISQMFSTTLGTIHLYKYGSKQYKPINIKGELQDLKFEVIDWDNMNFLVQEQRSIIERTQKKEDWRTKYLIPLAIIGAAALVFIIATYYASNMWTKGQVSCEPLIRAATQQDPINTEADVKPNIPIAGDLFAPKDQTIPGV